MFGTRGMHELFPDRDRCVHLVSYSAWDLYLLDNAATRGAAASMAREIPISVVLSSVALGLTPDVWQALSAYRARTATDVMISLHAGAKFAPQLRCAGLLQDRLLGLNITSSVFIESDSIHVKNVAAGMQMTGVVVLGSHAERANLKYTIVLWMLLGDADVFLGAHTSSLSRTAAQRTGRSGVTPDGGRTLQCARARAANTVYILTPSECADAHPACRAMSVHAG